MSKIQQYGRPFVTFDVENKEHRKIFHEILKYNTFGRSPVRFWLENEHNNLMNQISKDLSDYYLVKEFGSMKRKDEDIIPAGEVRVRPVKEVKRTNTRVAKK